MQHIEQEREFYYTRHCAKEALNIAQSLHSTSNNFMYMMTWTGPPSSQPSKWGRRQFTPLSLFAQNIAHCSEKSANCTAKHTITTKKSTNYNIIYDTKNSFSSSSLTKHFSEYCKRYCRIQLVLSFVFLIYLYITTFKMWQLRRKPLHVIGK